MESNVSYKTFFCWILFFVFLLIFPISKNVPPLFLALWLRERIILRNIYILKRQQQQQDMKAAKTKNSINIFPITKRRMRDISALSILIHIIEFLIVSRHSIWIVANLFWLQIFRKEKWHNHSLREELWQKPWRCYWFSLKFILNSWFFWHYTLCKFRKNNYEKTKKMY